MIQTVDARGLFTKTVVDRFSDVINPTRFLSSFFREEITGTKLVSIEVERDNESIAVDVLRGATGNRNRIDRATEKIIEPPYYHETIDITQIDGYDNVFGGGDAFTASADQFAMAINSMGRKIRKVQNKIDRAAELQSAQVLIDGIVTLNANVDIDFRRKAESKVDLGGANYWDQAGTNPLTDIEAGCEFVRTEGNTQDAVYNMILGSSAYNSLIQNTNFKEVANLRRIRLVDLNMPERITGTGASFHGQVGAGSYTVNIWTYPQFYGNLGSKTPYIPTNLAIIIPENPRFVLSYAAVPHVKRDPANAEFPAFISQAPGRFVFDNYIDAPTTSHEFSVKSAPIAIPVAVDTIYTMQVLA